MAGLSVGVIGAGAMGKNHVRILADHPEARLVGLADTDSDRAAEIAARHATEVLPVDLLIERAEAVVLAVPTVDHAELGCRILAAGRHLLVEKPIAASLEQADRLLAAAGDQVVAVGHVEFHNPAVEAVFVRGVRPRFVEAQRLSSFTPRSLDVDVILDLMIHDLQILHALDPSPVTEVRATGIAVLSPKVDIANVRLELGSGCVANLTASRVSADKVRKLRLFEPRGYYSIDYPAQEVKGYRLKDGPGLESIVRDDLEVVPAEPLWAELEAFLAACRGQAVRYADGAAGRQALATALDINRAMAAS